MKKLLVYLDQSYLSTMVKEDLSLTPSHNDALGKAMKELLRLLMKLVDQDKVICPRSPTHEDETGQDNRLEVRIYHILNELSDRVSFHVTPSIGHRQTTRALRRYLGIPTDPEDGRWEHAFASDPHQPIDRPRIYVHVSRPEAFARDLRRRKNLIQANQQRHFPHQRHPSDTFARYRHDQLVGVARLFYADPFLNYYQRSFEVATGVVSPPQITPTASEDEIVDFLNQELPPPAVELVEEYVALTGSSWLNPGGRYWEFFTSPYFETVPFWDIYTSIQAGLFFYKPNRRPKPSDHFDMAALATALPYVDIVTTDAIMKEMLGRLGLDQKYKVEVYSSRLEDVEALFERLSL